MSLVRKAAVAGRRAGAWMKRRHSFLQAAFLLLGGALFVHWVASFGTRELLDTLLGLPVSVWAGLLALYAANFACDVRAWQLVFRSSLCARTKFSELYVIRMAGEALNAVTPGVDIGGEPLKHLLCVKRLGIPRRDAFVSIVVARTTLLAGTVMFILAAASIAAVSRAFPAEIKVRILASAWLIGLVSFGVYWIQKRGVFDRLNRGLAAFYVKHPDRIGLALAYHVLGWCFSSAETYWMARFVGLELSPAEAFALEGLLQLVRMACFFIPLNLGAQEGGFVLLMPLWGCDPAGALGVSLLKRVRQITWIGAGYALGAYLSLSIKRK